MKEKKDSGVGEALSTLLNALATSLCTAGLRGRAVLVGLSGGLDSVCLLRGLSLLPSTVVGGLEAAHVDHGLREGSSEDAEFCRGLAAELGVPFHLRRLRREDFGRGAGVQAEARRIRRAFFSEVLTARGLGAVALGHHADDQAETVLYRLVRGTGPRGLGAMAPWAPPYLRPLLGLRRAHLEAAAAEQGWAHREDPSNRQPRYLRNRIRCEVLPLLRGLNPSVEAALGRVARLAAQDDELLSALARAELGRLAVGEPEGLRLPLDGLSSLAPALRRRLYLAAWEEAGCEPARLESRHLEAVDELALAPPGGRPNRRAATPGPGCFARSYGDLWVLGADAGARPSDGVRLSGPGRAAVPGLGLEVAWGAVAPSDAGSVRLPPRLRTLTVRPWRPGDRVGGDKVKDLLMQARVPPWRRAGALLAEGEAGGLGLLCGGRAWSAKGTPEGDAFLWLAPQEPLRIDEAAPPTIAGGRAEASPPTAQDP